MLNPPQTFNEKGGVPPTNSMALIIDLQDADRMLPEDAKAYFDSLAKTLTDLRNRNIPVAWVTIVPKSDFYPAEGGTNTRLMNELEQMGYHGIDSSKNNHEVFRKFLEEFGPRQNEVVFSKSFKSALVETQDVEGKPDYQASLEAECGQIFEDTFTAETTLIDHIRETKTQEIFVMGAVSTHCVAETAISGAIKGFEVTVLHDQVVSWEGEESEVSPQTSTLAWNNDPEWHREKMTAKITDIKQEDARQFSANEIAAIDAIAFQTQDTAFSSPKGDAKIKVGVKPSQPRR